MAVTRSRLTVWRRIWRSLFLQAAFSVLPVALVLLAMPGARAWR